MEGSKHRATATGCRHHADSRTRLQSGGRTAQHHPGGNMKRSSLAVLTAAVLALLLAGATNAMAAKSAKSSTWHDKTSTWYVESLAPANGKGTRNSPFNTLVAAENASKAGDTIVILRSPAGTPPLDGGIQLKAKQTLVGDGPKVIGRPAAASLPRIANTTTRLEGDAVRVATGVEVKNLRIVTSRHGAIYGLDAGDVEIIGNDVTAANASCDAPGGHWVAGAIMLDAGAKVSPVRIEGNMVRDINCPGDGITLRGNGTGAIHGEFVKNTVTRVRASTGIGMGVVSRDSSKVTANSYRDTVTDFGNPVSGHNESMYGKVEGDGLVVYNIDRAAVGPNIGTSSTNGLELWIGGSSPNAPTALNGGRLYSTVTNSLFFDNPQDMFEMNNTQAEDGKMHLTLKNVIAKNTFTGGIEPPFNIGTGQADCLSIFNRPGLNSVNEFRMINSTFENCSGDGIHAWTANPNTTRVELIDSTIANSGNDAIQYVSLAPTAKVDIDVEGSKLSEAANTLMAFNQTAPLNPDEGTIDLEGQNCFIGGDIATIETTGFNVLAKRSWWGSAAGPAAGSIRTTAGTVAVSPVLTRKPDCGSSTTGLGLDD